MTDMLMEKLAMSLAGHDKGHVYAVVKEEEGWVYLADGRGRTLEKPKRKNVRHVQMILHLPEEIGNLLGCAERDSDLVHVLRLYQQKER